jgi:hypothetical protein
VVTAELSTSGEKEGETEEEVCEDDGAEDEDKAGEDDAETTVGEAEATTIKPGTPPGDRSRIAQSASIWLSGGSLGALHAANGRVVTGGEGTAEPLPCDVWLLEFALLASVGGLTLTVTPGSSSMTVE